MQLAEEVMITYLWLWFQMSGRQRSRSRSGSRSSRSTRSRSRSKTRSRSRSPLASRKGRFPSGPPLMSQLLPQCVASKAPPLSPRVLMESRETEQEGVSQVVQEPVVPPIEPVTGQDTNLARIQVVGVLQLQMQAQQELLLKLRQELIDMQEGTRDLLNRNAEGKSTAPATVSVPPGITPTSSLASPADLIHLSARRSSQAILDNTHPAPPPPGEEVFEDSYRDKVELVSKTLGLDVSIEKKQKNFAMSVNASGGGSGVKKLPASANFVKEFDRWMGELKADEGSVRSKKKPGEPYDINTFPKRVHPKMVNYEIADCPWKVHGQSFDRRLLQSVLYHGKEAPQIKVKAARLKDWETSQREMLSMLSYMDLFTAASIELVRGMAVSLEEDEATHKTAVQELLTKLASKGVNLDCLEDVEAFGVGVYNLKEGLWNQAQDTISLLGSVGKGVQDNVKNVVDVVASSMVTRRDSWLDKFRDVLPKESLLKLRTSSLNAEQLFGKEALDSAFEEAREEKKDRVQDTFLASHTKNVAKGASATGQTRGSGFKRKAFQGGQQQQQQSTSAGNSGQPFRGRGRGRGRGQYNSNRGGGGGKPATK